MRGSPPFFLAHSTGCIYFGDDAGHCTQVLNTRQRLNTMYYSHAKSYLAMVTRDAVLLKFKINDKGPMTAERKVCVCVCA